MAKVRSPNYPATDLAEAIEAVRPVLKAENRNKMSKAVLAKHMGYASLNGRSLGKIGAVRAYGLIDGSGDELRVSDDAITVLHSPNEEEKHEARLRLALKPTLFQEISTDFPDTLPSEDNLTFWLMQRQFTQDAAGKAAKTYLETMRLASAESDGYNRASEEQEYPAMTPQAQSEERTIVHRSGPPVVRPPISGVLQEVFTLEEGPVTFSVPATLSPESYQDMADRIEIFLRGLKRRSDAEAARRRSERSDVPE